MSEKMGIVICKIPKAGLGNQLFPLMRAYTFAHLNQLPVLVYNYRQLKIGPWLRGEKSKRNYKGFFNFEKSFFSNLLDLWKVFKINKDEFLYEPEIKQAEDYKTRSSYFTLIPHYEHYFDGLQENRELVLSILWNLVSPKIKEKLSELPQPCIGVHIRMGDFAKHEEGVKFGSVGHTRSPEDYFIDMINSIRKVHGTSLPVSVFTDGRKRELKELFKLANIFLVEGNNDLTDLLLLSKSKIIITSAGSTFSYWAAFLSEAAVLMHPTYSGIKIRPKDLAGTLYEGAFEENNCQLSVLIRGIKLS